MKDTYAKREREREGGREGGRGGERERERERDDKMICASGVDLGGFLNLHHFIPPHSLLTSETGSKSPRLWCRPMCLAPSKIDREGMDGGAVECSSTLLYSQE